MTYRTKSKITDYAIVGLYGGMCLILLLWAVSDRRRQHNQHNMTQLNAFILVNKHDGLSDRGLEQLDQLLDECKK